jgi:hypothetical protein
MASPIISGRSGQGIYLRADLTGQEFCWDCLSGRLNKSINPVSLPNPSSLTSIPITEIISRAKQDFHMELDRESLVSAISKKLKSGRMFKRVAPNTFTTLDSEVESSP